MDGRAPSDGSRHANQRLHSLHYFSECSFCDVPRTICAVSIDPQHEPPPQDVEEHAPGEHAPEQERAPEQGLRARKKRASRLQTHRAALELVAEHGLGGVTVEMIAERAGISPRTFFNHWATKEAALLGVVFTDPDEIGDALRARPLDEPAPVALRAVLRDWMAAMPHDQDLRDLRKRVMAKEPSLHAMNAGRTVQLQGGLVAALEERLSGEDVHARAVIDVQIAFALSRSAFILSMASGTPLDQEFERVLELFDTGAALV